MAGEFIFLKNTFYLSEDKMNHGTVGAGLCLPFFFFPVFLSFTPLLLKYKIRV